MATQCRSWVTTSQKFKDKITLKSKDAYVNNMLAMLGMESCKPTSTPMVREESAAMLCFFYVWRDRLEGPCRLDFKVWRYTLRTRHIWIWMNLGRRFCWNYRSTRWIALSTRTATSTRRTRLRTSTRTCLFGRKQRWIHRILDILICMIFIRIWIRSHQWSRPKILWPSTTKNIRRKLTGIIFLEPVLIWQDGVDMLKLEDDVWNIFVTVPLLKKPAENLEQYPDHWWRLELPAVWPGSGRSRSWTRIVCWRDLFILNGNLFCISGIQELQSKFCFWESLSLCKWTLLWDVVTWDCAAAFSRRPGLPVSWRQPFPDAYLNVLLSFWHCSNLVSLVRDSPRQIWKIRGTHHLGFFFVRNEELKFTMSVLWQWNSQLFRDHDLSKSIRSMLKTQWWYLHLNIRYINNCTNSNIKKRKNSLFCIKSCVWFWILPISWRCVFFAHCRAFCFFHPSSSKVVVTKWFPFSIGCKNFVVAQGNIKFCL